MSQNLTHTTCTVATEHGSRYLQQLCKHWAHKFEVEFDPTHGRIAMPQDRVITLTAGPQALTIALTAPAESAAATQRVIDAHIERFAFREQLSFDWQG